MGGAGGASRVMSGVAGVFGVNMGNEGGGSGADIQDHAGGTGGGAGTGTIDPVDSGNGGADVAVANEAGAIEASSEPDCATHEHGKTFTPSGATSAHCYWPNAHTSSWQTAADACTAEGGHLATLGSSAESTFLLSLIDNLASDDRVWLGASDNKTATDASGGGPYMWITGEPFSYAPWAPANPDGNCTSTCGGKKCQCQHRVCVDPDGQFWDRWEDETYYSVCES